MHIKRLKKLNLVYKFIKNFHLNKRIILLINKIYIQNIFTLIIFLFTLLLNNKLYNTLWIYNTGLKFLQKKDNTSKFIYTFNIDFCLFNENYKFSGNNYLIAHLHVK